MRYPERTAETAVAAIGSNRRSISPNANRAPYERSGSLTHPDGNLHRHVDQTLETDPRADRLRAAWAPAVIGLAACVIALAFPPHAGTSQSRYCEKPGGPGNFLAASPGVSCATARRVIARVLSPVCVKRTRCSAYGFRCVAYWSGRFDQPFSYTNHALCNEEWSWIFWDGG